jgi:hypothetical protein
MLFTGESRKNITNGIRRIRISKVNNNTEKKRTCGMLWTRRKYDFYVSKNFESKRTNNKTEKT